VYILSGGVLKVLGDLLKSNKRGIE